MKYSRVDVLAWGGIAVLLAIVLLVCRDWQAFKALEADSGVDAGARVSGGPVQILSPGARMAEKENPDHWERDPFSKIQSSPVATVKTLSLNGISWDAEKPVAIINDTVVGVGEEVAGYKVVAIYPRQAVLNNGIEEIKLELPAEDAGL